MLSLHVYSIRMVNDWKDLIKEEMEKIVLFLKHFQILARNILVFLLASWVVQKEKQQIAEMLMNTYLERIAKQSEMIRLDFNIFSQITQMLWVTIVVYVISRDCNSLGYFQVKEKMKIMLVY